MLLTVENTTCLENIENTKIQQWTLQSIIFGFPKKKKMLLHMLVCLAEEAWIWCPFQENKSPLPACHVLNNSVVTAGDSSGGGGAGSPGALPGGRKRRRNCPAGPSPFPWGPVSGRGQSCTGPSSRASPSLRESRAGTVTREAASSLRAWLQPFPVPSLACLGSGMKKKKISKSMWCSHCWCGENSPTAQYTFFLAAASVCTAGSLVQGKQGPSGLSV